MDKNNNKNTDESAKKRKKPVTVGAIIILLLVAAGGFFGYFWLMDILTYVSTDDASIDGERMNISARILGRIKSISIAEGDKVGRSPCTFFCCPCMFSVKKL